MHRNIEATIKIKAANQQQFIAVLEEIIKDAKFMTFSHNVGNTGSTFEWDMDYTVGDEEEEE